MLFLAFHLQADQSPVELWCSVSEPMAYAACLVHNSPGPIAAEAWPANVRPGGWRAVSRSPDAVLLAAEGPAVPEARPRAWFRYEFRAAQGSSHSRSVEQLVEVDCAGGRYRRVEGAEYSKPNLEGVGATLASTAWSSPEPGSLDAAAYHQACPGEH